MAYRWLVPRQADSTDGSHAAPSAESVFAQNLKALRDDRKLSQEALAERMAERGFKWHQATVYKVEQGGRQIQLGEARTVAEILGIPLDAMTEGTENIVALGHLRDDIHELERVSARFLHIYRLYEEVRLRLLAKLDEDGDPWGGSYQPAVVEMLDRRELEQARNAARVDAVDYLRSQVPF